MASTGLGSPYVLTDTKIDSVVSKTSPGAYALGYVKSDGTFVVLYVGRSDDDLNGRLHKWVGERKKYTHFKAAYYSSPKAAFEKECHLYHDFGGEKSLDNEVHPARPANTNWECPVCTIFD